jgi:hypothetical protein
MESSKVLAFRIFVMLSCLIIVPMAAIFGSAFPDVVKSVLVDRIVAWSTGKPLESARSGAEEDGFSQVKPGENVQSAQVDGRWEAPRWGTPAEGVIPAGATMVAGGGNQSAGFVGPSQPSRSAPQASPIERAAVDEAPRQPRVENPAGLEQAGPPAPLSQAAHEPSGNPTGQTPSGPVDQPDRFTAMERKLREHGAVYYLLETWGTDGELYRFHCRMAIANNPNYTRHFEATDRDALKAMSQVLARVEAWRAGRLQ